MIQQSMDSTKNQLQMHSTLWLTCLISLCWKTETMAFCSLHDLENPIIIQFLSYRYIHVIWWPSVAPRWTASDLAVMRWCCSRSEANRKQDTNCTLMSEARVKRLFVVSSPSIFLRKWTPVCSKLTTKNDLLISCHPSSSYLNSFD